jgi:hypothetical protein
MEIEFSRSRGEESFKAGGGVSLSTKPGHQTKNSFSDRQIVSIDSLEFLAEQNSLFLLKHALYEHPSYSKTTFYNSYFQKLKKRPIFKPVILKAVWWYI